MKSPKNLSDIEIGKEANKFFSELFDEIYLVGGAIRADLLNEETTDLDYATPYSVEKIKSRLKSVGLSARDDAEKYGTISTKLGVFEIQITTYRSDLYTEGDRRPKILNVNDIDSDLSRRDFTINAMAASTNEFVDPYGGVSDIENKLIRSVGDPNERFIEDPLRILRAFRFVSRLGFEIEQTTLMAIKEHSHRVESLNASRIGSELKKLLSGDYWSDALVDLAETSVLSNLLKQSHLSGYITPKIVQNQIDRYTLRELSSASLPLRLLILFEVIAESKYGTEYAERANDNYLKRLGNWLEIGKPYISEISELFAEKNKHSQSMTLSEAKIIKLESELAMLEDEPGSMAYNTVSSALDFEKAKIEYNKLNLKATERLVRKSIEELDKNFKITLDSGSRFSHKLASYKVLFLERFRYLLACEIIDKGFLDASWATETIFDKVTRHNLITTWFSLSKEDWLLSIEEAVALVLKKAERKNPIEDFIKYVEEYSTRISKERKYHLLKNFLYKKARSKYSTSEQRRDAYKKLMEIEIANGMSEESEDYIRLKIDYQLWECFTTSSIDEFWHAYDELDKAATQVLDFESYDVTKISYLATASVLIHGLRLTDAIDDKRDITRLLISHFLMSRTQAGRRNAKRFKVYLDWFTFVSWVKDVIWTPEAIDEIIEKSKSLKTFGYIDEDEEYLNTHLSDIVQKRKDLSEAVEFLYYLAGHSSKLHVGSESDLYNIGSLLGKNLISTGDAFNIFRNWCVIQDANNLEAMSFRGIAEIYFDEPTNEPVSENVQLIQSGESEKVEFKETLRYNIHTKEIDRSGDLQFAALRTICAFMNSDGGKLFLGVSDNLEIKGLEDTDFKFSKNDVPVQKKVDEVKLILDELINKKVGSLHSSKIKIDWEQFEDRTFIVITVNKSETPAFCDNKFFIRTSSGCRELAGNELLQYVKQNFA